jgi:hypothetical protein
MDLYTHEAWDLVQTLEESVAQQFLSDYHQSMGAEPVRLITARTVLALVPLFQEDLDDVLYIEQSADPDWVDPNQMPVDEIFQIQEGSYVLHKKLIYHNGVCYPVPWDFEQAEYLFQFLDQPEMVDRWYTYYNDCLGLIQNSLDWVVYGQCESN